MDNVIINIEDIYNGYDNIKKSIDKCEEILRLINNSKYLSDSLNIDISYINDLTINITNNINLLYKKLIKIINILIRVDPSIILLFNYLSNNKEIYESESFEEKLDNLKNKNLNTNAIISENSESELNKLKDKKYVNKVIDNLKNRNNDLNTKVSLNSNSVFKKLNDKKTVNLVLDKIKSNTDNTISIKSINYKSILGGNYGK